MTVEELIEALQDFKPDAEVLVDDDGIDGKPRALEAVVRRGKNPRDRANHQPLLVMEEPE